MRFFIFWIHIPYGIAMACIFWIWQTLAAIFMMIIIFFCFSTYETYREGQSRILSRTIADEIMYSGKSNVAKAVYFKNVKFMWLTIENNDISKEKTFCEIDLFSYLILSSRKILTRKQIFILWSTIICGINWINDIF